MKTYLFVGGESDGERVPLKQEMRSIKKPYKSKEKMGYEMYERMELYGRDVAEGSETFVIYRHEDISSLTVMRKLLEHYNPKEE